MNFTLIFSLPFKEQLRRLPSAIQSAAGKTLRLLSQNPRHPSLRTHKVDRAFGDFSKDVFEAYVTQKYRLTWEYGPDQGMITLRNIDNHDECLKQA